ncbi:MAG: 23S rRNA (pseudouridine(1915)-N(3))-methyltransferase RlmH [Clostridium sp.]|nr:23S rRNA (pseudouridine(1915)-N(3))-methyltransferase RlmH [Clostridium sp.]
MMIKVICVGKLKEKYLVDAVMEYSKRISKYSNIQIIEVNDSNVDNEKIALEREKELILKHINTKDYIITLEIDGKQLTSIEFASKIDEIFIHNSNITFIIGGSYGISDEIKALSNFKLSFSKMTFPHQLFRVILLEQVYRSFKILNNEKYHK